MRWAIACGFAVSLAGCSGSDPVARLIGALDEKTVADMSEEVAAVREQGREADAVAALVDRLEHDQRFVRLRAAWALGKLGPDSRGAIPALLDQLGGGVPNATIVAALQEIGVEYAVGPLAEALSHKEASLRAGAAKALAEIGPAAMAAIPAICKALEQTDPPCHLAFAQAHWKIAREVEPVLPHFMECLTHASPEVRSGAALSLGEMGAAAKPAVARLIELLGDEDAHVRLQAAGAVGRIGTDSESAIRKLTEMAERDHDEFPQLTVGESLCQLHRADLGIPLLVKQLVSDYSPVRSAAAKALGNAGKDGAPAVTDLTQRLTDRDALVRVRAAEALWKITGRSDDVVPVLIDALGARHAHIDSTQDPYPRRLAAEVLGEIGPKARTAIAPLHGMLNDEDRDVREAVRIALDRIQNTDEAADDERDDSAQ